MKPESAGNKADSGIGAGHSTAELRENRREGRAATSIRRPKLGKAARTVPAREGYTPAEVRPCGWTLPANFRGRYSDGQAACRGVRHRTKMVGEPDAGNPHVRFDEGVQETCDRLCPTLPRLCEVCDVPPGGAYVPLLGM